jgi:ABC-type polysaccharide/polyol phosphate transport system ATPase subunit
MGTAIEVRGVSKRFRLYHEKLNTLKERATHFGRVPFEEFWALEDIDLEVEVGETVGLLGHNGSGKSTLLKCIAGILQPTSGEIQVTGRVASLLELGAGFHPDLTGRENVFLNGSVLGMARRDVERRFDEIVAFAELEPFIDNQVKHYSSGMYIRLGFAVAVNVEPDVLLVDEVLAVGDESFQRKCLDRVRKFQREGRTIVFVTHGPDFARQICDRCAVLDRGRVVTIGPPGEAVRSFREHLLERERSQEAHQLAREAGDAEIAGSSEDQGLTQVPTPDSRVRISEVQMDYPSSDERRYLLSGEPLAIRIAYEAAEPVDDAVVGIAIHDVEGRLVFGTNTDFLDVPMGELHGVGEITFETASVPLLDGTYLITVGISSSDYATVYDWSEQEHRFEVMHPGRVVGQVDLGMRLQVTDRK